MSGCSAVSSASALGAEGREGGTLYPDHFLFIKEIKMKIVTGDFCGRCKIAKQILLSKGYEIEEINIESKDGRDILEKTNSKEIPILIDNGKIFKGQEVVDFANKVKALKRV